MPAAPPSPPSGAVLGLGSIPDGVALRSRASTATTARVTDLGGRRVMLVVHGRPGTASPLRAADADVMAAAARRARRDRIPLVLLLASPGADVGEGLAALDGWGRVAAALAACSGTVPVLAGVTGPAVSGNALLLGVADVVVMQADSYAFVSGPRMVQAFTGERLDPQRLGGAAVHGRTSGVAALVADDPAGVLDHLADVLAHLPAHCDELPPRWASDDPPDRDDPSIGDVLPAAATGSYDVRDIVGSVLDADDGFLELHRDWAPNLVTGLGRIDGAPVGVVANQPCSIAGTLDIPASQKGARFVAMCDAFNVPIVTFVDTPGFYPGKDLEWRGMIRHGAQMAFAYARARVPRISVTLRKSYGGAYIVMDSKRMGCDLAIAWPTAEIAVMGARGAVEILHRRAEPEERAALELDYEERLLNPYVAADRGLIDAVVEPGATRRTVADALSALESAREVLVPRRHDNSPL